MLSSLKEKKSADGPPISLVRDRVSEYLRRIDSYSDPAVWIHRPSNAEIMAQAERVVAKLEGGVAQPLAGLTFAVKDNIDVAGMPTTAACPAYAYVAARSATAVQRLVDAGAIVTGKANLDQFATGLVGTRSPYGACRNVFDPAYVSGGSSSGSAVAVAANLVDFSLGTDTAGSGRVPAAFNNIVGLKPTRGIISTTGLVPACRSLDCISIFSKNCDMAGRILEVTAAYDPADPYARRPEILLAARRASTGNHDFSADLRFGVPGDSQLEFFGDADADRLYRAAVARAGRLGGTIVTIDFAPFLGAARLLYDGPWVAERMIVVKELLARNPDAILATTRKIIEAATKYSAVDAFESLYELQRLRRCCEAEWQKMDVLLLPTTGTIYTRAQVEADPVKLNQNLGYYTNFVNLLDLCALAVPNGFAGNGLPTGITFMAPAGFDKELLALGKRHEGALY